jgi:hypothetical protein
MRADTYQRRCRGFCVYARVVATGGAPELLSAMLLGRTRSRGGVAGWQMISGFDLRNVDSSQTT